MKNKGLKKIINGAKAFILPLVCYLIFFFLSNGKFGTLATLKNNAVKSVSPVFLAFGILMLVVEGNMDMSVGAQTYLTSIVAGNLAVKWNMGIVGIIVISIIFSFALCLIKAFINYILDISYNLLSIGFLLLMECFTYFLFNAKGVMLIGDITRIAQAPYCFIFLILGLLAISTIWRRSIVANHIRVIGASRGSAQMAGIDIKKDEFKAIMMGAPFIGIGSVFFLTNQGLVQATLNMASMSLCFDAMIAIFIGMSLESYISMPIAIVIGEFTIKMLGTGILSIGIPTYMQNVFTGLFLLIFMSISLNQNKFFEMRAEHARAKKIKGKYHISD